MYNPFNDFFSEYDKWFDENKDIYKNELKFIGKVIKRDLESIEIGVGTGRFGVPLGIKYGIEPSMNMAKIAKKNGMNVIIGTAEELPLQNNRFELILLNTVLCFIKDIKTAIYSFNKILSYNGIVVVFLIDRESPIGHKYMLKKQDNKFYKHADFFSKDEIIEMFEQYGFTTVKVENYKYDKIDGLKLIVFKKLADK